MSQYYYTLASLPLLKRETSPAITSGEFLERCRFEVGKSDYHLLRSVSLHPEELPEGSLPRLLVQWKQFETALRNALVDLRSQKLGLDPENFRREGETFFGTEVIAASAEKAETPLEAEKVLTYARLDFIEAESGLHSFDFTALLGYYLKLLLLERFFGFDAETGYKEYDALYQRILEKANG